MTVAPTGSSTTPGASTDTGSNSGLQELSGNFDTFLTLLTTQLQNQDPLSPMDSNQFTQQLVEFSGVEQQINTNQNLQTLINLAQGRSSADAVSYLGKSVTLSNGKGALINGAATWTYALNDAAKADTLTVSDCSPARIFDSGMSAALACMRIMIGIGRGASKLPSLIDRMRFTFSPAAFA